MNTYAIGLIGQLVFGLGMMPLTLMVWYRPWLWLVLGILLVLFMFSSMLAMDMF